MQTRRADNKKEIFYALCALTGFFLLLEVSYLIQCNHVLISELGFFTEKLALPASTFPAIFFFFAAQLSIHTAYLLGVWIVCALLFDTLSAYREKALTFSIGIWFLGIITILVANLVYFPNSKFSDLFSVFVPYSLSRYILVMLLSLCGILLLTACFSLVCKIRKKPFIYLPLIAFLAANVFLLSTKPAPVIIHDASTASRPNIIIIGIDALRPDFIGYFSDQTNTPFLDSFLQKASVFSDAVTPLARTYPSWISILSGQHPKVTGARSDLSDALTVHYKQSLPSILRRVGYHTFYATDEARFNNIDKQYDFDQAVTPLMGVNDFLLGSANDFPMSNLLANTQMGRWLFPYTYGNRPAYFNYDPDSFLQLVNEGLPSNRTSPLFLAIHFCLPHDPYMWATLQTHDLNPREWYANSIQRVDQQVKDFFVLLNDKKLLDHAIVVLLSDHGETLEMHGDRMTEKELFMGRKGVKTVIPHFYPPSKAAEEVNQSGGHGTDVLGLPQYHALLAFRLYGTGFQQIGMIPGVVSLLDVKPTVLDIVKIKEKIKTALAGSRGTSLANIVAGNTHHIPLRHLFIESDFSPASIRTVYPDAKEVLLEGIDLYQINPVTARLTVKPSSQEMIINSKQYADIYDHWILALYPQPNKVRMPILVDLVTGEWTNDLNSSFAKHSPAQTMRKKLEIFYADELHSV